MSFYTPFLGVLLLLCCLCDLYWVQSESMAAYKYDFRLYKNYIHALICVSIRGSRMFSVKSIMLCIDEMLAHSMI
ncbi:hypothetical protein V6Z12_A10G239900 [Gossypium hirsutum]